MANICIYRYYIFRLTEGRIERPARHSLNSIDVLILLPWDLLSTNKKKNSQKLKLKIWIFSHLKFSYVSSFSTFEIVTHTNKKSLLVLRTFSKLKYLWFMIVLNYCYPIFMFNRPCVARAVLQTPLSFID